MVSVDRQRFGKYANPEVERKYLLKAVPTEAVFHSEITDRYLTGTTLRLRKSENPDRIRFKLGQKVRPDPADPKVILHTNMYLSEDEFKQLSKLPGSNLSKTRHSWSDAGVSMFVDQFHGPLEGLVIAEIDFGPDGDPPSAAKPAGSIVEVTEDERFTGAELAQTDRASALKLTKEVAGLALE